MVPVSHVLWASCWLGVAADAVAIARAKVRAKARTDAGTFPPEARHLAETAAKLQLFRSEVTGAVQDCARLLTETVREEASGLGIALRMNDLKLSASRLVVEIVGEALGICGMDGYRNDTPFSVGRHLRDAHSAALMIHNQRLIETNASLWMVGRRDP
jgi:acyl-CoA dehydrogenase